MESPITADEADDSYQTLGVGRSLPGSPRHQQKICPCGREGRVDRSRVVFGGALFARSADKSRLHDFCFHRSRDHGDVCICIRGVAGARGNTDGLGHSDSCGGTRLAFRFGASAVTAITSCQLASKSVRDCIDRQGICK